MPSLSQGGGARRPSFIEPQYLPISPSQEIAELICRAFAQPDHKVPLSLLSVSPNHITFSVVTEEEALASVEPGR